MQISISSRIRNSMVGITICLCFLFTVVIFLLVYVIEDQVFVNQIHAEKSAFERTLLEIGPQAASEWQPSNRNIQRIDLAQKIPPSLPKSKALAILKSTGIHEYFDDDSAMFIAHFINPENDTSYYLLYDVRELLAVQKTRSSLLLAIALLTLFMSMCAVLLARRLSKTTLAPLSEFRDALQNNDLDHVVIKLAKQFSEVEIGIVVRELALSFERLKDAAQREYEFNRGVSHELRSPIQVAQSATELLQIYLADSDTKITESVSRLQRSVSEMNEIAETFLWLATDRIMQQDEMCSLLTLKATVDTLQSLFTNQEFVINVDPPESFNYPLPTNVLSVVLRNLIRNAVIHGDGSAIFVGFFIDKLIVTNSLNENDKGKRSFGVGMSIVQGICDRFDCQLSTQTKTVRQYSCSITFR